jgi:hypothetical protein
MGLILRLCSRTALGKAFRITMGWRGQSSPMISSCLTRLLCSVAGLLFLSVLPNSALGQCCSVPTSDPSSVVMNTGPLVGFVGTVSDPYGDSFNALYVYEVDPSNTGPDSDTCWWAGNPLGLPQTPSIAMVTVANQGVNYWEVNGSNQYGYDFIGWNPGELNKIVQLHPATVHMPCTYTVAQEMQIECPTASSQIQYTENILTLGADSNYAYKSCRNNSTSGAIVCGCGKVNSSGNPTGQIACSNF